MKKRIITGVIFALLIVPITTVPILFNLFQVIMTLFVIIAAIELIRMYEKEKKFDKGIALVIVLLTVASFLSVGGYFQTFNHPEMNFGEIRSKIFVTNLQLLH